MTCSTAIAEFGPDGTTTLPCDGRNIANPTGPFSGYNLTDFAGAMVGMFLEDTLPASAPPSLRFYVSNNSLSGIQTDFKTLSPVIGQVFFIGDGLTGTGSGSVQIFAVPPAATHLYLGFVDSCTLTSTVPGCYSDNAGSMSAIFQFNQYVPDWVEPTLSSAPSARAEPGIASDADLAQRLESAFPSRFATRASV